MTRLRRACLIVPATSWSKLEKAAGLDVDEVVIDLEDAVPVALKNDDTRRQAVDAIVRLPWRAPVVAVRVNAVRTPWFADDIETVVGLAGPRLACVVLPKVESAGAVVEAVRAIDAAAAGGAALTREGAPVAERASAGDATELATGQNGTSPGIEALIESALGVARVESIAEATPRLEALIFGAGDYAASMGLPIADIGAIDSAYPGDQWAYPRGRIAVAARAFGLDAIDGPYGAFRDLEGLAESARRARALGFGGKWAIHPDQIGTCMVAFSPTPEETAAARRTLADLEAAGRAGDGVAVSGGSMVDEASRRQAERILGQSRRAND